MSHLDAEMSTQEGNVRCLIADPGIASTGLFVPYLPWVFQVLMILLFHVVSGAIKYCCGRGDTDRLIQPQGSHLGIIRAHMYSKQRRHLHVLLNHSTFQRPLSATVTSYSPTIFRDRERQRKPSSLLFTCTDEIFVSSFPVGNGLRAFRRSRGLGQVRGAGRGVRKRM